MRTDAGPGMSTSELELESRSHHKKHFRACEFCRQRKVACDAEDSPDNRCTMCTAYDMECKYEPGPAAKMTRKRPSKKYVQALETRLSQVENLLKKLEADALTGDDAEKLEGTLRLPKVAKQPHPDWSSIKVIYPRGVHPTTDSSEEVDLSENEEASAVTDVNFKGYMGKSSNVDLVRTVLDLKRAHNGASTDAEFQKRFTPDMFTVGTMVSSVVPPFKYQDFPAPKAMAELVDLYFVHFNAYLPLLHRPTFESELKSALHVRDRGFGAVVLLVCATSSAWAHGSQYAEPHQTPGWQWFNQVSMTEYSLIPRPRLYDVQACALMAAYMNTTNSPQGTLPILSLGIRMAQDVGAHRKKMYSATPTIEQELWKRAFWTLVAMDRLASFGMGRQCITQDEDIDVDPMTECDDEYWLHPDPSKAFQQPPGGKPSNVAFCNAFIRLLKIEAFALRTIFTTNKSKLLSGYVGPEWKQRIVAEIDSSLNKWRDTIPSHLRWDPDREDVIFLNQSAILYSNYYQLQIFVQRSFISSPPRPPANANPSLPSMNICTSAARACLRVLEVHHRRSMVTQSGFTLYALTPLQMPLFTVGTMFLVSLWAGTGDTHATRNDLDACLSMMKELSDAGNLVARKLRIVLRAMCPNPQQRPGDQSQPQSHPPPGPSSSPSANLAKEGPQTIDELVAAAMQQLAISGFRVADGSDARADPTNGEILSLVSVPRVDSLSGPSPFVRAKAGRSSGCALMDRALRQTARDKRPAGGAFAGGDMRAGQLNVFGSDFVPAGPPAESAINHESVFTASQTANANHPPPRQSSSFGPVSIPTPSDMAIAGPSELDFTFDSGLMADNLDLDFFGSLTSMLGNSPSPPPSAAAASSFGAPQPTAPCADQTTVGLGETWFHMEWPPAPPPAYPVPMQVQGEGSQNSRSWQWIRDQWEAYCHQLNQEGGVNMTQPRL